MTEYVKKIYNIPDVRIVLGKLHFVTDKDFSEFAIIDGIQMLPRTVIGGWVN